MKTRQSIQVTAVILLTGLLILPLKTHAQSSPSDNASPINITASSDKTDITIGEHVVYKIKVRHSRDITVHPPDPHQDTFLGFERMDFGHKGPDEIGEQLEETFWFKLRGDRVGYYSIQNIKIPFISKSPSGDSIPGEAKAPPYVIQVRSVLYENGQPKDIRDIKPIIGAGVDWRKHAISVLVALGAVALVTGLINWWRRSRKQVQPATEEKLIPPHELALRELDHLINRGWVEVGMFREFAFELSEIFRRYLGSHYHIPALDWTTEEILYYFSTQNKTTPQQTEQIEIILSATDQMKFAKAEPELSTLRQQVKMVKAFLESTSTSTPATEIQHEPSPSSV